MTILDFLNAKELNKYYKGVKELKLVEVLFPATYSNNFSIETVGSVDGGTVKILKGSELDADVMMRDFEIKTTSQGDKQFFREGMRLNEKQRKEFLEVINTNNQVIIDNYSNQIYKVFAGDKGFLASPRAIATLSAAQFLATGKVSFNDENPANTKTIDYRLDDKYKEALTGTHTWDLATADPIQDLISWRELVENNGGSVEIALMSRPTYNLIKNSAALQAITSKMINFLPTEEAILSVVQSMTGLKVLVWNEKLNIGNKIINAFPDNVVTLIPSGELGTMEYGPTPTKTDQLLGLAGDREIEDIDGTFATVEVETESKSAGVVRNVNVVVESLVAPNPTIVNSMFIARVK